MASKVKIKCPGCSRTLEITNKTDAPSKTVKCPVCGSVIVVRFAPPKPAEQSTEDTVTGEVRKTVGVAGGGGNNPRVVCGVREYPLAPGRHTIGRQGREKCADIMLDVNDMTLSRLHAVIEVTKTEFGIKVTIANHEGKNGTTVDGVRLGDGDVARLHDGSRIRLANTELTFKN